jgi:hypothetical protein
VQEFSVVLVVLYSQLRLRGRKLHSLHA